MATNGDHVKIFLLTISIVGTIGNLIVAFVYWKKKDKQTSTFFILVLAFIDVTVCCLLVPLTIYMEAISFETESIVLCKAFFFLTTTTVPSSSLLMTAIAFDRYFCICMINRNLMTLRRAKIIGVVLLTISSSLGVIPAFGAINQEAFRGSNASEELTLETSNSSNIYYQCILDVDSKHTHLGFLIMPFKFCYDFIFLASVIIITALYVLIYKNIYLRRKAKREYKQKLVYSSMKNGGGLIKINDYSVRNKICNLQSHTNKNDTKNTEKENVIDPLIQICHAENQQNNLEQCEQTNSPNKIDEIQVVNKINNTDDIAQLVMTGKKSDARNNLKKSISSIRDRRSISHVISTKDIRTAFMLFVVSFLFISFYMPSIAYTYLTLFIPNFHGNLYMSYLYFSNSAINPIIYCFLNPTFRIDLIKLFLKRGFLFNIFLISR